MTGIIWYDSGSIIEMIHADWEAYPIGNTIESALENLSWYKTDTKFYKINDIDGAILFVNKNPKELRKQKLDPFSKRYYHIALWHSNLIELHDKGFINGVKPLTAYQYELMRYNNWIEALNLRVDENYYVHYPDGTKYKTNPKPSLETHDNTDLIYVDIPEGYINLTPHGIQEINKPIKKFSFNQQLSERVNPLMKIEYYDSAVREASILVEITLKEINNTNLFGLKLVDSHYNNLISRIGQETAYHKFYRSLLRSSVSFIRNEYAHNFPITNQNRAKRLLLLFSKIIDITEELENCANTIQD